MKHIINGLLLLCLFGVLFARYCIVIVAGQSNCLNIHTRADELPACAADTLVPFFYDLYYPPNFAPNDLVTSSDNLWETLKVHERETSTGPDYAFFGPEMTLARTLMEHMDSVAIFKYGVAGSDLAYDWGLGVNGGPEIFDKFVVKIRMAEQAMISAGEDFEWYAATWMQGESDADDLTQASNYYRNLGYFIKCLRDTLNKPGLPFVIGRIADELRLDSYPYRDIVLDAQQRRADADSNTLLVNTADYEMDTDDVHFNSSGVMSLGTGFAEAILHLSPGITNGRYWMPLPDPVSVTPNPARNYLGFEFHLPGTCDIRIDLYDILGRHIKQLMSGNYSLKNYRFSMPVGDINTGIYFIRYLIDDYPPFVKKVSIIK